MDETSPNIAHFLRLFNSRSIIEKKTGETKNGIFLQIAPKYSSGYGLLSFPPTDNY